MSGGEPSVRLHASGISWWNRRAVLAMLRHEGYAPRVVESPAVALAAARRDGGVVAVWASKLEAAIAEEAGRDGIAVVRVEDGFLRSVGLGAGLVAGASYALDRQGIYYDATATSDLEAMLEGLDLAPGEVARGGRLRELIVALRLSKYNLARPRPELPRAAGRLRVLVPGQVSADAAVRRTVAAGIDLAGQGNPNLATLAAARARNPQALIVYRPHPDVAAGLRPGAIPPAVAARHADVVTAEGDVVDLIEWADRVETLSSLTGFEALLRGKEVVAHGLPFYAGWGLTSDLTPAPRRRRRRRLDELIAVVLTRYCRHVDPRTLEPLTAEELIGRLAGRKTSLSARAFAGTATSLSWLGRKLGL